MPKRGQLRDSSSKSHKAPAKFFIVFIVTIFFALLGPIAIGARIVWRAANTPPYEPPPPEAPTSIPPALPRNLTLSLFPIVHIVCPTIPRRGNPANHPIYAAVERLVQVLRPLLADRRVDLWLYNLRPGAHPAFDDLRQRYGGREWNDTFRFFEIHAPTVVPLLALQLSDYLDPTGANLTVPTPGWMTINKYRQTLDFGAMMTHFYYASSYSTVSLTPQWDPHKDLELYMLFEDDFLFCADFVTHFDRMMDFLLGNTTFPRSPSAPPHVLPSPLPSEIEDGECGPLNDGRPRDTAFVAPVEDSGDSMFEPNPHAAHSRQQPPADLLEHLVSTFSRWSGMRFSMGNNGIILQHRDLPFLLAQIPRYFHELPIDTMWGLLWLNINPPGPLRFGGRKFYTYRFNQMLHIGENRSTVGNSDFTSNWFECLDPVTGMGTVEVYTPGCGPYSDWSPCLDPRERSPTLFRGATDALAHGPSVEKLKRRLLEPRGPVLVDSSPMVRPTPSEPPMLQYFAGGAAFDQSCTDYCRKAHHPLSKCNATLLEKINTCGDMHAFFPNNCTNMKLCQFQALPFFPSPGWFESLCTLSLVPRRIDCDAHSFKVRRLCACVLEPAPPAAPASPQPPTLTPTPSSVANLSSAQASPTLSPSPPTPSMPVFVGDTAPRKQASITPLAPP